ncbi:MAG: hypothetical protein OEV68_18450, partial [candidate division Zixibacteria bacterium]|nr:hypothetical protein [candidate division Zixibacteria bacterium]
MRFKSLSYAFALILLLTVQTFAQSISLDHVDGLAGSSTLGTGRAVVFHIRISNPTDTSFDGIANGFQVFSP